MEPGITVVIPSLRSRFPLLQQRALPSVLKQTVPARAIVTVVDTERAGAWDTRNRGMDCVTTDWMAFLDDDDDLLPHHLETLLELVHENQADVAWGWFEVVGSVDPFPSHRGRAFNADDPHVFPITTLVRTELVRDSRARFMPDTERTGAWDVQDLPFWRTLWDAGATFSCTSRITWRWWHHSSNTSGLPNRH